MTRRHAAELGLTAFLLAAVVTTLAVAGHRAYATVPVTVDGQTVVVPRGTPIEVVVAQYSRATPGDLLSAADKRVVRRGAGEPVTALVNGGAAQSSAVLRTGDRVRTVSGADVVEPVVVETRTVEVPPRYIGDGPLATVVAAGDPGIEVQERGAVSGDVLATQTIASPRPGIVRRAPLPGSAVVALTFDDGPWPGQTERVLAVLEQKSVPATFFMLGHRVKQSGALARAGVDAGHTVGNHTDRHPPHDRIEIQHAEREIVSTSDVIAGATGARPRWFRPPGGRLDERSRAIVERSGMSVALWTADPQDWREATSAEEITQRVVSAVRPGAVVLLHDGGGDQSAMIEALPSIIDELRARGYEFVTLDEMPSVRSRW